MIYKTLTFSLIENLGDPDIREFIMMNFITIFENDPTIPVETVAEPFIKQIKSAELEDLELTTNDFDFLLVLARSSKLKIRTAIKILDLLGKVYINDYLWHSSAAIPFMQITSRFLWSEAVAQYLEQFVSLSLRLVIEAER